ncbi:MAG: histidine phosphatase family protein [Candidatus Tectomicrobia bacterium]|uniref:Histidine phosphatase family protein n=1 Tax=Tectimicrobiota bacterium TaxID=2528274 RepID=A0A932CLY3_UNCTE|nr:histidine phosphatase family protein [Candidatus Tectomicrobia bacterium]
MIEIWLVRHGQTVENCERIIQGQLDGKLSPEGIEQARRVAEALKDIRFDAIYSSDLGRARETTHYIQAYHPDTPVIYSSLLREKNFGVLQGKRIQELDLSSSEPWQFIFTRNEGEPPEAVAQRARELLRLIQEKHPGQKLLLVGHGFFNSCFINILRGEEVCYANLHRQMNTAINYFCLDEPGVLGQCQLNSTEHLGGERKPA